MTNTNEAPQIAPEIKVSAMINDAENQLQLASEIMDESIAKIRVIAGDLIERQEAIDEIALSDTPLSEKCQRVKEVVSEVVGIIMEARGANDQVIDELQKAKCGVLECKDHITKNAHLAMYDQLTGAGNRHKYYEDMQEMKNYLDNGNGFISFAILDIDFFKSINDQHGHEIGDAVLKTFAQEIRIYIQGLDAPDYNLQLYRFGGEEFVIVGKISITKFHRLLDDFRSKIANKAYGGKKVHGRVQFTFSGGISGTNSSDQLEHLFPSADKKLYQSKQGGRNRITA